VGRLPAAAGATAALPEWWGDVLASASPTVLVTQGTFNIEPDDLVVPVLEALGEVDALVMATTLGAALPVAVPSNARIADFLPFRDVLPHVDLVISNGGWGGVLEVLSSGIPMIIAGGDLDKPEIAARIARSGAGIDLRTGHPASRSIAVAYDRVRRGDYSDRARAIGEELRSLGGTAAAADLIERLGTSGAPVLAPGNPWG